MCNTRNINQPGNNEYTNIFCHLDADFSSASPEVQAQQIDITHSMIYCGIHSTGTDFVMSTPHNVQSCIVEYFFDYIPEELKQQPNNSFYCLITFVAPTDASKQFTAVLPIGGSAIPSSSQSVSCSNTNSNSNSNNITNITNISSVVNPGLVNGSTIWQSAMSLGG